MACTTMLMAPSTMGSGKKTNNMDKAGENIVQNNSPSILDVWMNSTSPSISSRC